MGLDVGVPPEGDKRSVGPNVDTTKVVGERIGQYGITLDLR